MAILLLLIQGIEPLVKKLTDDNGAVREEATRKLIDMGEAVLPLLEPYERTEDPELRARLAEIRRSLTRFRIVTVFEAAEDVLANGLDERRATLAKRLREMLNALSDDLDPTMMTVVSEVLEVSLAERNPFEKENRDAVRQAILAVAEARGTSVGPEAVIICRSAEFDTITNAVVICLGDVKAKAINNSLIIARGKIDVGIDARRCTVFAGGGFACGRQIRNSAVWAPGGASAMVSTRCVWINTPDVQIQREQGTDAKVTREKVTDK